MKFSPLLFLLILTVFCAALMSCADMPDTQVTYGPDGSVSLSTHRPLTPVYPAK